MALITLHTLTIRTAARVSVRTIGSARKVLGTWQTAPSDPRMPMHSPFMDHQPGNKGIYEKPPFSRAGRSAGSVGSSFSSSSSCITRTKPGLAWQPTRLCPGTRVG